MSYITDDCKLVDVCELCVDKLPQRLLLVSLGLRHCLMKTGGRDGTVKREEEKFGRELLKDNLQYA